MFDVFDHFILLPKYFENALNRENQFGPDIRTLLIQENIFFTICLKNSSDKIHFHERSWLYRSCHNPYIMFCYVYYCFTKFFLQSLHLLIDVRTFSFSRHIRFNVWQSWMDKHKSWFIWVPSIFLPQQIILRIFGEVKIVKIM